MYLVWRSSMIFQTIIRPTAMIAIGLAHRPGLRFLALQPISANLKIRLAPAPDTTIFPVDFFLTDDQGHVSQGEIGGATVEVRRINLPRGLSDLELSVKAKKSDQNAGLSVPVLAELDGIELGDIFENYLKPGALVSSLPLPKSFSRFSCVFAGLAPVSGPPSA